MRKHLGRYLYKKSTESWWRTKSPRSSIEILLLRSPEVDRRAYITGSLVEGELKTAPMMLFADIILEFKTFDSADCGCTSFYKQLLSSWTNGKLAICLPGFGWASIVQFVYSDILGPHRLHFTADDMKTKKFSVKKYLTRDHFPQTIGLTILLTQIHDQESIFKQIVHGVITEGM